MGAPFWTEEEKNYFLKEILPRSVYASGKLNLEAGRTFEDLVSSLLLFLPLFDGALATALEARLSERLYQIKGLISDRRW
jgi:hypothetical protein